MIWEILRQVATWVGQGFISAVWPVYNAELALAAGASMLDLTPLLVLGTAGLFALGHVAGKVALIVLIRRGAVRYIERTRIGKKIVAQQHKLDKHPGSIGATVLASAVLGFPPLILLVVVIAGTNYSVWKFATICFAGRFVRFAAILFGAESILAFL